MEDILPGAVANTVSDAVSDTVTLPRREYDALVGKALRRVRNTLMTSGRVGLAVMRIQPLHKGHASLIWSMIQDCDVAIIGVGSTQESGTFENPFTFDERVAMLRAVFGDLVRPIPLQDIGSDPQSGRWVDYVLDRVAKMHLPEPTDYYAGARSSAGWYVPRFAPLGDDARIDDPLSDGPFASYASPDGARRTHVLDRDRNVHRFSGTETRSLIAQRDPEWYRMVPAKLVPWIEARFPAHLRVAA